METTLESEVRKLIHIHNKELITDKEFVDVLKNFVHRIDNPIERDWED